MQHTSEQYDAIITSCRDLFSKKMKDYGSAWRILRLPSLTDQIYIKAQRIRSLQENEVRKVGVAQEPDLSSEAAIKLYNKHIGVTKSLMEKKNHDYGEAWRDMRISSLTDLIIQKLLRVKQIEDNKGKTLVSEGIEANYQDIINYSVFALIHMNESND